VATKKLNVHNDNRGKVRNAQAALILYSDADTRKREADIREHEAAIRDSQLHIQANQRKKAFLQEEVEAFIQRITELERASTGTAAACMAPRAKQQASRVAPSLAAVEERFVSPLRS